MLDRGAVERLGHVLGKEYERHVQALVGDVRLQPGGGAAVQAGSGTQPHLCLGAHVAIHVADHVNHQRLRCIREAQERRPLPAPVRQRCVREGRVCDRQRERQHGRRHLQLVALVRIGMRAWRERKHLVPQLRLLLVVALIVVVVIIVFLVTTAVVIAVGIGLELVGAQQLGDALLGTLQGRCRSSTSPTARRLGCRAGQLADEQIRHDNRESSCEILGRSR